MPRALLRCNKGENMDQSHPCTKARRSPGLALPIGQVMPHRRGKRSRLRL